MAHTKEQLKEMFQSSFDLQKWTEFIIDFFKAREVYRTPEQIDIDPSEGRGYVLGYLDTSDTYRISFFYLKLNRSIDQRKVGLRQLIDRYIKIDSDAGIGVFDDGKHWRLSFITDLRGEKTSPKRYTFVFGERQNQYLTAIDRFMGLQKKGISFVSIKEAFSVEALTKQFYNDLFNWYTWALKEDTGVYFPNNPNTPADDRENLDTKMIRLITRLMFVWFIKQKGLVPDALFNPTEVDAWLKDFDPQSMESANYYQGILQNLFFATLNRPIKTESIDKDGNVVIKRRKFAKNQNSPDVKSLYRYIELFKISEDKILSIFEFIPFINGGLFECLDKNKTQDGVENAYFEDGFSRNSTIKNGRWTRRAFVPNKLFFDPEDGIISIFNRYNFTVEENSPSEQQVALDPELLGKVFENLLGVFNPETNETARKQSGSFYTPREIVHYMCQETLISYLRKETGLKEQDVRDFILLGDFLKDEDTAKNRRQGEHDMLISEEIFKIDRNGNVIVDRLRDIDNALANIRVADPAVGSGAFPLGMLNEIVRARQNISAYMAITMDAYHTRMMYNNERSPYALKLQTIKNCIFAADIEPSAVDIAQLRLWLSLVIDDEINPDANSPLDGHKNPIPLPNLECNIVCGNSLIDEFEGIKLINFNDSIGTSKSDQQQNLFQNAFDAILPSLLEAQDALFRCDDTVKKQELREKIEALKDEIIRSQMQVAPPEAVEKYRIARNEASKPFVLWQIDFARVFREKGGFDIVIGNPPYVGEKGNKELFRPIAATEFGRKYYCGKMDLFYFFFHKAIDLGKQNAEIAFITTNYYPTAFGGKVLREDFKDRTQIRKLINFNELKIFESALGQHNMITLLTKDKTNRVISQNCICRVKGTGNARILDEVLHAKETKHEYFDYYEVTQEDLYDGAENYIRIAGCGVGEANSINSILAKIAASPHCLKDIAYIKQGIVSGADKYTDAHERKYHLGFIKGTGIFVLNKEEIEDLNLPDRERSFVKGVYKNSQVSKYHIDYTDELKVLYITKDIQENEAPTIINHLKKFKPILESKRETQEGKIPWYSLHWPRDKFLFESEEKIVNSRRAKQNIFALETKKSYEQSDLMITVIRPEYHADYPPKYVLALLNSKLYYVWLKNKGKLKGDMLEIYGTPLEEIPVQIASETQREKIISLVESLLSDPDDNEAMNTLDEEIYQIFDLTESEKELVRAYCE